jgi:hypothetical protein
VSAPLADLVDFPYSSPYEGSAFAYVLRWTFEAMPDGFPASDGSSVKELSERMDALKIANVTVVGMRSKPESLTILVCEKLFPSFAAAFEYRYKLLVRGVPEGGLVESEIRRAT